MFYPMCKIIYCLEAYPLFHLLRNEFIIFVKYGTVCYLILKLWFSELCLFVFSNVMGIVIMCELIDSINMCCNAA